VDELAVLQVDDVLRPADEGRGVARHDVLVVADPEDEGGGLARRHDLVGEVDAEDRDPVGALDVAEGLAHALRNGLWPSAAAGSLAKW
jgi:hypothetical protein